jgi:hypothetical protein
VTRPSRPPACRFATQAAVGRDSLAGRSLM